MLTERQQFLVLCADSLSLLRYWFDVDNEVTARPKFLPQIIANAALGEGNGGPI